ncbi:MAG: DUF2752 domain-containing protein [Bdellovibrionales bacterium]|nr:DUF2752 domain-containing protein [Bdellovibrionales bacterium]
MLARLILVIVVLLWGVAIQIGRDTLLRLLDSMPPSCPVKIWLGFKCAFCGMTHAFLHLVFFDIASARQDNPLSLPFFVVGVMALIFSAVLPARSRNLFFRISASIDRVRFLWSSAILLIAFAVLRNHLGF